ncbi:MAG: S-methyl-5'-thioadenosine phosphorylase [Pseudomonadales bacterium]|jgi:5'-methylthioadenosine phosphorylase|nr:S-methyl-5'-thioadenosine phosphorylase [Pseudomonadales bacterium]MDP7146250.1 S-methyl-5'-thioadenosine phosphorylase [Pseudomonadales bacterium]MDP7359680.1 S-methyl-5'-thioadenosine phosphorylase [Pseudomonadales bacterium]MDP7595149.1 S-methyl-5'-thioadenosine phosphorylase [Pseudomonadales bacterium]HJN50311.1 S-methyl-5'-thioadenosine phosphorylase [Pseudomonadales bacterium]|tara:strand:+ start:2045 stop:2797 length:753 start_codon:yes stop_codon:yes gene_type:complete
MLRVGVIGGSGLDDPQILTDAKEIEVQTPYGDPSSTLTCGEIGGVEVRLLARHGRAHELSPTQVNYQANIHALHQQNVSHIITTTACGSLREEIDRGHLVIADQFIDFTRHRKITFKESFAEEAGHTAMADPFDGQLRQLLIESAEELGYETHHTGTILTIEGPRFSTRAESRMFRIWGADVVNMSIAPEAILANELEIPYAVVAMSTDYDCWKEDEAPVSWDEILRVFDENADHVKNLLSHVIPRIAAP